MINNFEPTEDEILKWAYSIDKWPKASWDYYVWNGPNDDLIFKLANDENCKKQDFFIHALYYLVGETINKIKVSGKIVVSEKKRIEKLFDKINSRSVDRVKKWQNESKLFINNKIDFDSEYWFNYMFY